MKKWSSFGLIAKSMWKANLGPCWVQIGSSMPSCSNLEASWGHVPRCPKWWKIHRVFLPKLMKIDAFPAPEKQKNDGKQWSGSKFRKNHHAAKTYRFGSHLGAMVASSWGTWEGLRGHFGRLGANLSQHKPILSHLGANLGPLWANMTSNEPTWSPRNPSGRV